MEEHSDKELYRAKGKIFPAGNSEVLAISSDERDHLGITDEDKRVWKVPGEDEEGRYIKLRKRDTD